MKTIYAVLISFLAGALAMFIILNWSNSDDSYTYVQLDENFFIDNVGELNKGTVLRVDQSMPEGFTRYILYLNLKGGKTKIYNTKYNDEIIPYWLQNKE